MDFLILCYKTQYCKFQQLNIFIGGITLKRTLHPIYPNHNLHTTPYVPSCVNNMHPSRPPAPSQPEHLSHIRATVDMSRKSEWCDEVEGDLRRNVVWCICNHIHYEHLQGGHGCDEAMAVAIGTRLRPIEPTAMQTSACPLGRSPDTTSGAPQAAERSQGGDADEFQRPNSCPSPCFCNRGRLNSGQICEV